jgi:NAD+ synthase
MSFEKSTIQADKVNAHIVQWLKDYAHNAKVDGFVVGISGGVDSAVTSTLCAQTGYKTLCVEMPIHQHESHVSRAREHIALLAGRYPNVESVEVDLTPVFQSFQNQAPSYGGSKQLDLSLANTRARLRMTTLYYLAGIHRLLVAGTGNKVEDFGVGFYTKYGDGGVDLGPIADLMKSDIYALAHYLDLPVSIQLAKPTDGLFGDNRTDEDQLGASYDELEWAMAEWERGKRASDFEGRKREAFEIFEQRNKANRHKMEPIPVCVVPESLKQKN